MELKKLREYLAGFPVISMEERPVMSSEMENMLVKNPFTKEFYLRNKILLRITTGVILLLVDLFQIRNESGANGHDFYTLLFLAGILAWFVIFHIQLLFFADYPALASLSLIPFLTRIELIFNRYIQSFRLFAILAGFYLQVLLEQIIRVCNANAYLLIRENNIYRFLLIAFFSVSAYILLLHFRVNKYKKWMMAVRSYKEGISDNAKKH